MVTFAYIICSQNKTVQIESASDVSSGTGLEKQIAQCLNTALQAAAEEVLRHYKNGVILEKADIARQAAEVARNALDQFQR